MNELVALITVHGTPEPAGSKRHVLAANGHGRVIDANPKSRHWKDRVAQAAGEQYGGELVNSPLIVNFIFRTPRPKGHFGTGRNAGSVRSSAPSWPTTRPDLLKLARGVEDALTGVIWRDDAQIIEEHLAKRYGEPARCEIAVYHKGTAAAREAAEEEVVT